MAAGPQPPSPDTPQREPAVSTVRAGAIEMEVAETGHGDRPLLLVHGYTGSRDDFREVLPELAREGRVLAIDQRGHGGSSNSGDEDDYTLEGLAEDLYAAVGALGLPPFDLLGHSMGGMVALRLALAHPGCVRSLVLMDTAGRPFRFLPPFLIDATRPLVEGHGMARLFQSMRDHPRPRQPAEERCLQEMGEERYWERIGAKIRAMDPAAYLGLGSRSFEGVLDRLAEIDCPTTVLVGEQDVFFREPADELEAGIAGARQVVIPDAAHSPQLENRSAWLSAVREHLARVRA